MMKSWSKIKTICEKKIGVETKLADQYLTNAWLRGRIDEVLGLSDGSMAPLDYKFAEYKEKLFETYRIQQYCYACLIEENFGKKVNRGFIVYTRSKHYLLEVPISEESKKNIKVSAEAIQRIIESNFFPKATKYKRRCVDCTYRNICIK